MKKKRKINKMIFSSEMEKKTRNSQSIVDPIQLFEGTFGVNFE